MKTQNASGTSSLLEEEVVSDPSRRRFFQLAGGIAGAGILLSACHKSSNNNNTVNTASVSLGAGDTGILNYAYALEQLEAAFYTAVVSNASFTTAFPNAMERALLTDIRDHEIAHREFFKAALSTSAIAGLTVDFSSIDFTSRTSVLNTAKAFEDLGVSAYNYAGQLIASANYLTVAGKIVSVEARHAAYIRDLITPGSFADTLNANGLDLSNPPSYVLSAAGAGAYVKTTIDFSQLPTL